MKFDALTPTEVLRARAALAPHLPPTPLRACRSAGRGGVFLKLECWQPTGSFKVRGALNLLLSLTEGERRAGLLAASAGNHALGVAHAVAVLGGGIKAELVVPRSAPQAKVERLRAYPVEVHVVGENYDEAYAASIELAAANNATYVHPYDDVRTAAGQGTIALEILSALPEVEALVVPVGGGGLISGIAVAAKALSPGIRIVAVQAEASPALRDSLAQGRPLLDYPAGPTLADGIAGGIGEIVFEKRALIDAVVVVPEIEIERAIVGLLMDDHVVAEASGAVGVAAVRAGLVDAKGSVAIVVTGANIDRTVLARLIARHA